MALSDRIPYQAQVDRPKLTLPGGKKLAVWVILNVEEWRIENAMPRTVLSPPMGQPLLPDVPNWSWHEYGMRAGFWRQFKALTDRKIPVTLALNANVCNSYPRVASAALEAGFERCGCDARIGIANIGVERQRHRYLAVSQRLELPPEAGPHAVFMP